MLDAGEAFVLERIISGGLSARAGTLFAAVALLTTVVGDSLLAAVAGGIPVGIFDETPMSSSSLERVRRKATFSGVLSRCKPTVSAGAGGVVVCPSAGGVLDIRGRGANCAASYSSSSGDNLSAIF